MDVRPGRRTFCVGIAAALLARPALAQGVVHLAWADLVPAGDAANAIPPALRNLGAHDESATGAPQAVSSGVRTDWNGRTVRMDGYVIPVDYGRAGTTAFILVPYVGACIHVPPPPPNQLVFVTTDRPWRARGLFEAVTVTGMFGVAATSTSLADIAYALRADRVEAYRR